MSPAISSCHLRQAGPFARTKQEFEPMPNGSNETESSTKNQWSHTATYTMAAVCLMVGLLVGNLLRVSAPSGTAPASASVPQAMPAQTAGMDGGQQKMPSLEEMKKMADSKAA